MLELAKLCGNCKHFYAEYSKKNGFCGVKRDGKMRISYGYDWRMFKRIWNGETWKGYIESCAVGDFRISEKAYSSIKASVDWWKLNKGNIHTCHRENVCSLHEQGKNNTQAIKHINNSKIKWLCDIDES